MHFEQTKTNIGFLAIRFLLLLIIFEQLMAETVKNLGNQEKKFLETLLCYYHQK